MNQEYQPLHHKYRPIRFDDLIGQEAIATTLKQAILTNKIAPAYLFSGPRGTGKTSSARILARSLNCLVSNQPTIDPCGKCELCETISVGSSLDVIEIDAASNTGVDNIRELIERSRFAPVQARWKVYVIDECHMLSTAAFNALLKTLEEPPPRVVFILATTDPQRVIPTILSRCQRFDFRRIPVNALTQQLEMIASNEAISIENDALHLIAQRAQGGLRDAESMLDQLSLLPPPIKKESVWNLLGAVPEEELIQLASAMAQSNPITLLEICRDLLDLGRDPISILQGLASVLRDLVVINAAPELPELLSLSKNLHKPISELSSQLELDQLLRWQAQLKGTENQLRLSMQPRLWLEVLLLGMLAKPATENHQKQEKANVNYKFNSDTLNKESKDSSLHKSKNEQKEATKVHERFETINSKDDHLKPEYLSASLSDLWQKIIARLELPSTRMLLSQQAKLIRLTNEKVEISVSSNWESMIQSRINILEEAISNTLGSPRKIIIKGEVQSGKVNQKEIQENSFILKQEPLSSSNSQQSKQAFVEKVENKQELNLSNTNQQKKEPLNKQFLDKKAQNLADFFNGKIIDTNE